MKNLLRSKKKTIWSNETNENKKKLYSYFSNILEWTSKKPVPLFIDAGKLLDILKEIDPNLIIPKCHEGANDEVAHKILLSLLDIMGVRVYMNTNLDISSHDLSNYEVIISCLSSIHIRKVFRDYKYRIDKLKEQYAIYPVDIELPYLPSLTGSSREFPNVNHDNIENSRETKNAIIDAKGNVFNVDAVIFGSVNKLTGVLHNMAGISCNGKRYIVDTSKRRGNKHIVHDWIEEPIFKLVLSNNDTYTMMTNDDINLTYRDKEGALAVLDTEIMLKIYVLDAPYDHVNNNNDVNVLTSSPPGPDEFRLDFEGHYFDDRSSILAIKNDYLLDLYSNKLIADDYRDFLMKFLHTKFLAVNQYLLKFHDKEELINEKDQVFISSLYLKLAKIIGARHVLYDTDRDKVWISYPSKIDKQIHKEIMFIESNNNTLNDLCNLYKKVNEPFENVIRFMTGGNKNEVYVSVVTYTDNGRILFRTCIHEIIMIMKEDNTRRLLNLELDEVTVISNNSYPPLAPLYNDA